MNDDLISRQAVQDKYRECLVNSLKDDERGIDLSKYAEEPYRAFCEFMDSIPPVNPQVPKTDVLDKIRAEIEGLTYYWCEVNPRTVIDEVLEIIDKYREESKDADSN